MDAYRTKEMRDLLNTPVPYEDPLLIPWGFSRSTKSWGDVEKVDAKELAA
jgi:hypothetical protein